ncbi:DUF7344 domain-containing protein [Halolamina sp. C58]|uniref:DUF7344 domain-containing protein n=1 Tax=Halolamina sp. C58 TaxID=3421640 RepID=UPI003EBD2767
MKDQLLQSNTADVPPTKDVPTERGDSFERDIAYSLLSSRRRRNVLHALYEAEGESTVADLARQLAAWETDQTPATISSKERKRSYTALRQTHLPKLAKHGLVEYDANRGTVRLTDSGRRFRPYLWGPVEHGGVLGLALTAACSAVVVALLAWAGVAPFALLGGYQLAGVVALAFGVVTVGSYIRYRPARLDRRAMNRDTQYEPSDD